MEPEYSIADQPERFARARQQNDARVLDIDSVYDGGHFRGLRVLVTGANRGIGLALARELVRQKAFVVAACRTPGSELPALAAQVAAPGGLEIHEQVDVTQEGAVRGFARAIAEPLDVVINNAGYFYEPLETLDALNFAEELRMIDICALGPLRVTAALRAAGRIKSPGGRVAVLTSQGGSIAWRAVQNPEGHDYGHHMSKAAANMMAVLLANELKTEGVSVSILHPGFNKTDMTRKYADSWEVEGAVDPAVGAKRVLHEIARQSLETTGRFVNCEDGREIPW